MVVAALAHALCIIFGLFVLTFCNCVHLILPFSTTSRFCFWRIFNFFGLLRYFVTRLNIFFFRNLFLAIHILHLFAWWCHRFFLSRHILTAGPTYNFFITYVISTWLFRNGWQEVFECYVFDLINSLLFGVWYMCLGFRFINLWRMILLWYQRNFSIFRWVFFSFCLELYKVGFKVKFWAFIVKLYNHLFMEIFRLWQVHKTKW